MWGATIWIKYASQKPTISIHAPRVGSDHLGLVAGRWQIYFNPRSPCGERPSRYASVSGITSFQSTLPVWGATAPPASLPSQTVFQSTLPVWGATFSSLKKLFTMSISIHAPRVGSDLSRSCILFSFFLFQSTLPVWGATIAVHKQIRLNIISIHAPRVGSDSADKAESNARYNFNPRSPCGERHRHRPLPGCHC